MKCPNCDSTIPPPTQLRPLHSYILEIAGAVAFVYLIGGYAFHPAIWALLTVVAVAIFGMRMLRYAGLESSEAEARQQVTMGFLMFLMFLVGAIWQDSPLLFAFAGLLGWMWISERRSMNARKNTEL